MTDILYYPHYTPSRTDLRRFLLLYDTVATIVPYSDQPMASRREHLLELGEFTDENLIRFCDPHSAANGWFNAPDVIDYLEELLADNEFATRVARIQEDLTGPPGVINLSAPRTVFKLQQLKESQWSELAFEKIPADVMHFLHVHGLAYPMQTTMQETNPFLLPNQVHSTIISRLAREICDREGLHPLAHTNFDATQFLRESNVSRGQIRSELIAVSLEIAVPSRIGQFSPEKYMELRQSLAEVRLQINVIADNLLVGLNLDSASDIKQFREMVADKVSDINNRIEQSRNSTQWKSRKSMAVDFIVGAAGGVVGAAVGGIPGAIGGAAVGSVVSRLGHKLSARSDYNDLSGIKQLGLIRERVLKAPLTDPQRPMSYMI